ncbi:choice-of-anchor D domain-containing protein [bacterium]|nr:choice-of-anchor D domain-containing protein [bacterium]
MESRLTTHAYLSLITAFFLSGCGIGITILPSRTPATALLVADPTVLDFGGVDVGDTSDLTVTFTNSGNASATQLSADALGAPYSLSSTDCGVTLAAGASCQATITLAPSTTGAVDTVYSVSYSDGTETQTLETSLTGEGTLAPVTCTDGTQGVCIGCADATSSVNGCSICDDGQESAQCQLCDDGATNAFNSCYVCDDGMTASWISGCTYCDDGSGVSPGGPGCVNCGGNTSAACVTCDDSMVVGIGTGCTPCDDGATTGASCTTCGDGNSTAFSCESCDDGTDASPQYGCTLCDDGNTSMACTDCDSGGSVSNANVCTACDSGAVGPLGSCTVCTDGSTTALTCSTCDDGFTSNSCSYCDDLRSASSVNGCTACDDTTTIAGGGTCIACDNGNSAVGCSDCGVDGALNTFCSGDGSIGDPYAITTVADLRRIVIDMTAAYELLNDIDFANTYQYPIGINKGSQFGGSLDGNGFKIRRFRQEHNAALPYPKNQQTYMGLFSFIWGGHVQNLTIEDSIVSCPTGSSLGMLAAWINSATISNVHVSGTVSGKVSAGGFASRIISSAVSDSSSSATVTVADNAAGGISGSIESASVVTRTFSTGDVTGKLFVGGFSGTIDNGCNVEDSYSTGDVTAMANSVTVGGFVGDLSGAASRVFAAGAVSGGTGTTHTGGLVGTCTGATLAHSYWDTDTSGMATSACGTGRTTSQMQDQATYSTWDFSTIWNISPGQYPVLR